MTFLKELKAFLMKENFDYKRQDISLHNFHPQLRIFLAFNGNFFNNADSKLRFVWPGACTGLTIVALVFEVMFVHHGLAVKDYSFATECFCYIVLLGVIPVVYTSVLINRNKIFELLDSMNKDYLNVCSLGSRYKIPFLRGQLLIWQLCYAWFFFVSLIVALFILSPTLVLVYRCLFATQGDYLIRPLPFPMWLPKDDPYRTPNYEVFFFLEIVLCFIMLLTFCVYVYTQFHVLLHHYNLINMIELDFEVIFEGLDDSVTSLPRKHPRRIEVQLILNNRVKRIVCWHISVLKAIKTISSVYGPPLVYQVMFSSIPLSLIAYQVADKLDHGKLDVLFAFLGVGCCVQLWIPCFLGTLLRNKAFAIADACWNCGWHEKPLGRLLRMDIIIITLRAQQPVTIKFTGLPNVQLETFSSIMSTAYSYFNMLRQYNKDINT